MLIKLRFCLALACLALVVPPVNGHCFQEPDSADRAGQVGDQSDEEDKDKPPIPTIAKHVADMQRFEGFFSYYWDAGKGVLLLEIDDWDREFLHVHSLATGLGSNPVGLDRGQLGSEKLVQFRRIGPKVLLIQRNLRFRARTDNLLEQRAVEQSFAQSVVWGGKVVAETDGTVLVDITKWLLSDIHGVADTLKRLDQGDFKLDADRSALFLPRCKAFPDNTEFESTLTFATDKPGRYVRQTTPSPNSVALRQHHSFVRLPDDGYQPRRYDVRSPSIFITFADYASPLDANLQQRWITRHRLIKKDPQAARSEPVEPIVYYVDPGAPQQIQQALIEGASWWNQAFESAGFLNAFQVKLLPPDADPLDVRYNVIQWVHRSTRGWSYGGSVIDPRTGEIIKGHVTLGSLRVRQDRLLMEGLAPAQVAAASCGIGGIEEDTTLARISGQADPLEIALARIRQLSAHEVGHTLGFVHNFAASTYRDRASVMDYPAPRVLIDAQGGLDLSDAYAVGIGDWDRISVQFAYSDFPEGVDESIELDKLLTGAANADMIFLSDDDARPAGAAEPMANLWDDGSDPLEQLKHVMRVRRIALKQFDPANLPAETTTADIAEYLTPVYLHHRYQLQAAGKLIGGSLYQYGYTNRLSPVQPVVPARQHAAIDALLATLDPDELVISPSIIAAISPRPYSTIRDAELLPTQAGRMFDPLAAARIAAQLTLDELFQHERLARLTEQAKLDAGLTPAVLVPGIVARISSQCGEKRNPATDPIGRIVREAMFEKLVDLLDRESATEAVRSAALAGLAEMLSAGLGGASQAEVGFREMLQRRARQVLDRPLIANPKWQPLESPPGSPIGAR